MIRHAIVEGALGRIGSAFVTRLERDGFTVHALDKHNRDAERIEIMQGEKLYLFDCALQDGCMEEQVQRVQHAFSQHRLYDGIFVPSSWWLGDGSPYGQAKLLV